VTESGLKLIVWLVAASLLGATLAIPQPVDPWEMPSLVLDRAAVSDAIRLDETLALEMADTAEVVACLAAFSLRACAIIFDIRMGPPGEFMRFGKHQSDSKPKGTNDGSST